MKNKPGTKSWKCIREKTISYIGWGHFATYFHIFLPLSLAKISTKRTYGKKLRASSSRNLLDNARDFIAFALRNINKTHWCDIFINSKHSVARFCLGTYARDACWKLVYYQQYTMCELERTNIIIVRSYLNWQRTSLATCMHVYKTNMKVLPA